MRRPRAKIVGEVNGESENGKMVGVFIGERGEQRLCHMPRIRKKRQLKRLEMFDRIRSLQRKLKMQEAPLKGK